MFVIFKLISSTSYCRKSIAILNGFTLYCWLWHVHTYFEKKITWVQHFSTLNIMKAFYIWLPKSNVFLSCVDKLYIHIIMYVALLHWLQCSDILPPHRFLFLGGSKEKIGKNNNNNNNNTKSLYHRSVDLFHDKSKQMIAIVAFNKDAK